MRVSPANLKAIAQSGSATAMANALMNAARHIESLQQALIAEQELTERLNLEALQAAAAKCKADCNDYACVRMDACTGHHGNALSMALREVPCGKCNGTGLTTRYNYDGNGSDADDQPCPHCALDREVAQSESRGESP
jgi:DnaJ-class molecular chaperone